MTGILVSLAAVAVAAAAVMTVTALVARRQGRVVVVDVAWPLALTLAAVAAAVVGTVLDEGAAWRAWALAAAVGIWGLRLASHIHRRSGDGEDPRYEVLLGGPLDEVGMARRRPQGVRGPGRRGLSGLRSPSTVGAVTDVGGVRWSSPDLSCG